MQMSYLLSYDYACTVLTDKMHFLNIQNNTKVNTHQNILSLQKTLLEYLSLKYLHTK